MLCKILVRKCRDVRSSTINKFIIRGKPSQNTQYCGFLIAAVDR